MGKTLDTGQYATAEIAKYEAIYGRNFVSPGGLASTQAFTALLDLHPGMRVLDVGCGLGGAAFYMAQQYGVQVQGIDLSHNMLALAHKRCQAAGLADRVTFTHGDILAFAPAHQYDRIYSRDVFLHIHAKEELFQVLKRSLAPGGRLLFTDYCCGEGEKSPEFAAYIHNRGYDLRTVVDYRRLLEEAGFVVVSAEERTDHFLRILEEELALLSSLSLDAATIGELRQSWQAKLARARRGEQRWALFYSSIATSADTPTH
jgi:phosphoethanolamine N-methyltransferase